MAQIHSGIPDLVQRCRVCLTMGYDMSHLLDKHTIDNKPMTSAALLQELIPIEVPVMEPWPEHICNDCKKKANDLYLFKSQCLKSHEVLIRECNIYKEKKPKSDDCRIEFQVKRPQKHSNNLHACVYCQDSLPSASLLARHMDNKHSDMKFIKCVFCDKTFFKQANLRLHLTVHSGVKKHMCEVCGMSFALAGNLAAHRRLHTGSKPYVCKECNRGFTQQAALRSHEAGHSNAKDHMCTECGAAFSRAGALSNHKKRHLSVKPFVCSVCEKAFTFSSERKRHMTIHTGEKKHQCDICGSRFNRNTNLTVHRRIHTGESPHVCTVCGKRFNQAHCLRTHMVSHNTD